MTKSNIIHYLVRTLHNLPVQKVGLPRIRKQIFSTTRPVQTMALSFLLLHQL